MIDPTQVEPREVLPEHASGLDLENTVGPGQESEISQELEPALTVYLRALGRFPLLTKDQEKEAGTILKLNRETPEAKRARETLITSNLRLVVSFARKYQRHGVSLEDLIAEGNQGLIVAVDRFDPVTFENRFSTFASAWIMRYIQRALNRARLVRTPKARLAQTAEAVDVPGFQETKETARAEELAPEAGHGPKELRTSLEVVPELVSIHADASRERDFELDIPDTRDIPGESITVRDDLDLQMDLIEHQLNPKERFVIMKRFGINGPPQTWEEIAQALGTHRGLVKKVTERALKRLRRCFLQRSGCGA